MKLPIITLLTFVALSFACGSKDENSINPPVSDVPSITIEKIEPLVINQFDPVLFEIKYLDGDGDIGTEDADDHALEILDIRDNIIHTFHVPPQSPATGISISGVLVVEIDNIILLDQSNSSEEIVFSVRLKDREENWSKSVTSDVITVNK